MYLTVAPALHRVGLWAAAGKARTLERYVSPGSPSAAELSAFTRAVRPSAWHWLSPLVASLSFSTALMILAGAAPQTTTVQRMLAEGSAVAARFVSAPAAPSMEGYRLPEHWQGSALRGPAAERLGCDPLNATAC